MTELESSPESELEGRLRTSLGLMAPPATSSGVFEDVQRRVARRRRRVREVIGAALVVLVGGGTAAGLALTASPQLAAPHFAHATTVPSSTSSSSPSLQNKLAAGATSGHLDRPAPTPPPCPANQIVPTMASGRFCGPTPPPGNGLGASGLCTGQETAPPCRAGAVVGRFYAYTVPGTCIGLMTFDGRQWVSELPPPSPVPDWVGGTPRSPRPARWG
jgi:hypothetical protein